MKKILLNPLVLIFAALEVSLVWENPSHWYIVPSAFIFTGLIYYYAGWYARKYIK